MKDWWVIDTVDAELHTIDDHIKRLRSLPRDATLPTGGDSARISRRRALRQWQGMRQVLSAWRAHLVKQRELGRRPQRTEAGTG